jgi:hypothetical protein
LKICQKNMHDVMMMHKIKTTGKSNMEYFPGHYTLLLSLPLWHSPTTTKGPVQLGFSLTVRLGGSMATAHMALLNWGQGDLTVAWHVRNGTE